MKKPIDFAAVRTARENLDRIAAEHPELRGQSTAEDWERVLSGLNDGAERQRKLTERRIAAGMVRAGVWLHRDALTALQARYPGPRGGVDWNAVLAAALQQESHP